MKKHVTLNHFNSVCRKLEKFMRKSIKSGGKTDWDKIEKQEKYLYLMYFRIKDEDEQTQASLSCLLVSNTIKRQRDKISFYSDNNTGMFFTSVGTNATIKFNNS